MNREQARKLQRQMAQAKRVEIDCDEEGRIACGNRVQGDRFAININQKALGEKRCVTFDAHSPDVRMHIPYDEAREWVDIVYWPLFTPIEVSNKVEQGRNHPFGWHGTIEEEYTWDYLVGEIKYRNRLAVNFHEVHDGLTSLDFKLEHAFSGGLVHELGYFQAERSVDGKGTNLRSYKELRYGDGLFCSLPEIALEAILFAWLSIMTAEYASKLTDHLHQGGKA